MLVLLSYNNYNLQFLYSAILKFKKMNVVYL